MNDTIGKRVTPVGVNNYQQYKVTTHAKDRILTRFNITNKEFDEWVARLLSQCTYVETQENNRVKYRYHDIVLIVDPKQKSVITVYSINAHDDISVHEHTNPEIKSVINKALTDFVAQKKRNSAIGIHEALENALEANSKMIKPSANYRFTDKAWDDFIKAFHQVKEKVEAAEMILQEVENKKKEP